MRTKYGPIRVGELRPVSRNERHIPLRTGRGCIGYLHTKRRLALTGGWRSIPRAASKNMLDHIRAAQVGRSSISLTRQLGLAQLW